MEAKVGWSNVRFGEAGKRDVQETDYDAAFCAVNAWSGGARFSGA
jgi:hypothetical protein